MRSGTPTQYALCSELHQMVHTGAESPAQICPAGIAQDASELSELWASVGALFAEGDVNRIAAALATMRRSVSLVGHVPEFHGSTQRLAVSPSLFQPCHAFAIAGCLRSGREEG